MLLSPNRSATFYVHSELPSCRSRRRLSLIAADSGPERGWLTLSIQSSGRGTGQANSSQVSRRCSRRHSPPHVQSSARDTKQECRSVTSEAKFRHCRKTQGSNAGTTSLMLLVAGLHENQQAAKGLDSRKAVRASWFRFSDIFSATPCPA